MHELPDDLTVRQALRDGLRALPVPDVSPDFDSRVLDALRAPRPWWWRLWEPAKPLLLGASCSLSVTLVLREMEGLDYEEIAAALGIPVGTVRSRLHAARAQFRALWTAAGEKNDHA